jgi:plasmid maintenance system antidote protein VapI
MTEFALLYRDRQLSELLDLIEGEIGLTGETAIFLVSWLGVKADV